MNDSKPLPLTIWTIYEKGTSGPYPSNYVARLFSIEPGGPRLTDDFMVAPTLEMLRDEMKRRGLFRIARFAEDEPNIIESWL